jgi:hypothetical protein
MEEHNDIELRSEKVRNIIGNIPPLLIRSGISFMAFIVGALLLAGWFVPYPENLSIPIEIKLNKEQNIQATACVPYSYITRLKTEMPVEIEMEGYGAGNYGYIKGVVCSINKSAIRQGEESYFTITIQLLHPNTKIELMEQMKGRAFILLSNESIVKHIFKNKR